MPTTLDSQRLQTKHSPITLTSVANIRKGWVYICNIRRPQLNMGCIELRIDEGWVGYTPHYHYYTASFPLAESTHLVNTSRIDHTLQLVTPRSQQLVTFQKFRINRSEIGRGGVVDCVFGGENWWWGVGVIPHSVFYPSLNNTRSTRTITWTHCPSTRLLRNSK